MPVIGQVVSVSHNSNGTAAATTTGTVWNKTNPPAEGYQGLYRKEYGSIKGQAFSRYDENTGVYTQYVDKRTGRICNGEIYDEAKGAASFIAKQQIQLKSGESSASVQAKTGVGIVAGTVISMEAGQALSIEVSGAVITINASGEISVTSPAKIEISAPEIRIQADDGDAVIQGISLVNHTHRSAAPGAPSSPPIK